MQQLKWQRRQNKPEIVVSQKWKLPPISSPRGIPAWGVAQRHNTERPNIDGQLSCKFGPRSNIAQTQTNDRHIIPNSDAPEHANGQY